jgi:transcriptional regulator with XRE-family HTH domain
MNAELTEKRPESLSDRLRIVSKKAGSLKALAGIADISYPTFMRYVNGTTEPKGEALANIVSKLEVDGTWLLTGKNESADLIDQLKIEIASRDDVVRLPKFSEKIYRQVLETADDFDTRSMLMQTAYSTLYQSETTPVDKDLVLKLLGTTDPQVVVFDYQDLRSPNSPVRVLVDLYHDKPKQSEKALIMYEGALYIMRTKLIGTPPVTMFVDESTRDPLPPLSFDTLVRNDCIVGTIVTSIYKG